MTNSPKQSGHLADGAAWAEVVREALAEGAVNTFRELIQAETLPLSARVANVADLWEQLNMAEKPAERMRAAAVARIELPRKVPGLIALLAPASTMRFICERYLPPDSTVSEDILMDVAGELTNVIAGQVKTALKGTPFHFQMSTPKTSFSSDWNAIWAELAQALAAPTNASTNQSSPTLVIEGEFGRLLLFVQLIPCEQ